MISKEYLHTAQALLRSAKSMTDEAIASRLMALAADYERRVHRAALAPAADRAGASPRLAKPS